MANKASRGRWHPSRTSGIQKQMRERDIKNLLTHKKHAVFSPLDISQSDWSIKKKGGA